MPGTKKVKSPDQNDGMGIKEINYNYNYNIYEQITIY